MGWKDLGSMQEDFAIKISELILWARDNGIRVRKKDCYRDPRVFGDFGSTKPGAYGQKYSVHKLSLAQDLWTKNEEDHRKLHDQWDKMGGAPRINNDMNHYSLKFEGFW